MTVCAVNVSVITSTILVFARLCIQYYTDYRFESVCVQLAGLQSVQLGLLRYESGVTQNVELNNYLIDTQIRPLLFHQPFQFRILQFEVSLNMKESERGQTDFYLRELCNTLQRGVAH